MKYLKKYNNFLLEYKDFLIYNNQLTTLVGEEIPEIVDGNFDCGTNMLSSLEGSPKKVNVDFICSYNSLTSLKHAPKYVGNNFKCVYNCLKNLNYLPEYIGGELYCYENEWVKPIPTNIMIKYNLHPLKNSNKDLKWVYTDEQFKKFKSFYFQKEFLEREPENFIDLKPFGYARDIEELFPHLFDMDDLGLID